MKLLQYKLRPLSAWRTPWQADTLTGLLCWAAARLGEHDFLENIITAPALRGEPAFVLSDAFPGDLLPIPFILRLQSWPEEHRKTVKQARWLTRDKFTALRQGISIQWTDLINEDHAFTEHHRLRNTLNRITQGTPEHDGLWTSSETWLSPKENNLSIYARVTDTFVPQLTRLLHELSITGFGADRSSGQGQFELLGEPVSADWLVPNVLSSQPPGCVSLSTFQPGPHDPTDGFWETFVKYGKLGPDFGLENVFKRPVLMLRPGACFSTCPPLLGRAIPMDELLTSDNTAILRAQARQVVQFAFGLNVPFPFFSIDNI